MKKTLLDLGRVPTMDELRAFFKENDFTSDVVMDLNYDTLPSDTVEFLEYAKDMLDEHFEPLSREMGLKSHSSNCSKDNPLIALRDNFENLVSSSVFKLIEEQPDTAAELITHFMSEDGEFDGNADTMLHNAVEKAMKVMQYEETASVVQEVPTYEDYNHRKNRNYRAADFDKKWNHTRANTKTTSIQDMVDDNGKEIEIVSAVDVSEEVLAKITYEKFWSTISDDDKKLLRLRMDGLTQEEIAKELGYKTHSAVTKRLQKLKEIFENCA